MAAENDAVQTDFSDLETDSTPQETSFETDASSLESAVLREGEETEIAEETTVEEDPPFSKNKKSGKAEKPKSNMKQKAVSGLLIGLLATALGIGYLKFTGGSEEPEQAPVAQAEGKVKTAEEVAEPIPEATPDAAAAVGPDAVTPEVANATESLGDAEDTAGENDKVPPATGEVGYIGGDTTAIQTNQTAPEVAAATTAAPANAPTSAPAGKAPAAPAVAPISAPVKAEVAPVPQPEPVPQANSPEVEARLHALEDKVATLEAKVETLTIRDEENKKKIASLEKKVAALKLANGGGNKLPKKQKSESKDYALLNDKKIEPAKAYTPDLSSGGDVPRPEVNGVALPHYDGSAIVPDRAWVTGEDGVYYTITVGDTLPGGYGEVISIDDKAGVVEFSSGAKINFN